MQRQKPFLVMVSGVSPAECDLVIEKRNQPVIRDRHTVSISAQIAQHLIRPAERWFAIDDPAMREKLADKTTEKLRLGEPSKISVELQLAGVKGLLQSIHEFAAEDLAEDRFGDKEISTAGPHPMRLVAQTSRRRQQRSAHGDDAAASGSRCAAH